MKLAELFTVIKVDTGGFDSSLSVVNKRMDGLNRRFDEAKKAGAIAFAGISAAIGFSLKAAADQESAVIKLTAALKATGNQTGHTRDQLIKYSQDLEKSTTFTDEAILSVQALLATFKNVSGPEFTRATEIALDMSEALGQDLKSSAIQVGKALNDPVVGASALRRVGVSLTEQQMDQIKAFTENGEAMKAQKVILDELTSEFGGNARAAVNGASGQYKQLTKEINNVSESLGNALLPTFTEAATVLRVLTEPLTALINQFNESNQSFTEFASSIYNALTADLDIGKMFNEWLDDSPRVLAFLHEVNDIITKISSAVKGIGQGALDSLVGVGNVVAGAATLDYGRVRQGARQFQGGGERSAAELKKILEDEQKIQHRQLTLDEERNKILRDNPSFFALQ